MRPRAHSKRMCMPAPLTLNITVRSEERQEFRPCSRTHVGASHTSVHQRTHEESRRTKSKDITNIRRCGSESGENGSANPIGDIDKDKKDRNNLGLEKD